MTDKNNLAEKIFSRLDKEEIKPVPKWFFIMKDKSFWVLGLLSLLFGSLAIALLIFTFNASDFVIIGLLRGGLLGILTDWVPFIWIIVFVLFSFFVYENIIHTNKGYRYSVWLILGGVLTASFILGTILYWVGVAEIAEREIGNRVPIYKPLSERHRMMWDVPQRGIFFGQVGEVQKEIDEFSLLGPDGRVWDFDGERLPPTDWDILIKGDEVRVVIFPLRDRTEFPDKLPACAVLDGDDIPVPPKFFGVLNDDDNNERTVLIDRINECKGVRPYSH